MTNPWDCADCSAKITLKNEVKHDAGCPHAAGINDVSEMDRIWFEKHPMRKSYKRPLHWIEKREYTKMHPDIPPGTDMVGTVTVTQIAPGFRRRVMDQGAYWVINKVEEHD